jgi:AhpC/TSA family
VAFVGVDGNDEPASGLAFARASGVSFPVAEDTTSAVAPRFGLYGYPDTVFVDAHGDVAGVVRGPITKATLVAWLHRLAQSG